MNLTTLIVILAGIIVLSAALIWLILRDKDAPSKDKKSKVKQSKDEASKPKGEAYSDTAEADVEHIFNDEFREELRNRGRLHFEKIISENAMFLQQDLRITTSQLNDYMKDEITRTLQEEFTKYEESIADAKKIAIESINKTQTVIEQQRQLLGDQLQKQIAGEKDSLLSRFDENMAEIVNHYVLAAIGDQIDLSDQLEYILNDLEANKEQIIEDIRNGA
ncbi:MAG: hypothetical protein WCJ86_01035 [Candidatus Saccharibacteria bacterium]